MLLEHLKNTRCVLIKDVVDKNVMPLFVKAITDLEDGMSIALFCYEQPAHTWRKILPNLEVQYYPEGNPGILQKTEKNSAIFIDSFNQLFLLMGAQNSFKCIQSLLNNIKIKKVVIILHMDCLPSAKIENLLDHMSQLIIIPDDECTDVSKLRIHWQRRKGGKIIKSIEDLHYNDKMVLTVSPVENKQAEEDGYTVLPHSLATFKIGLESKEILDRNALQLPYLKQQESGKVHYEHDEADDWDDEDPDDDLDI